MRKSRFVVVLMTLLLSLMAAAIFYTQEQWENFPFSVVVEVEGRQENIRCLKKIPDTFYVFLPGYANRSQMHLQTNRFHPVSVEGTIIDDGTACDVFPLGVPLRMTYSNRGKTIEQTLIFLQSGQVSTLYLDTVSGNMDYVNQSKENFESGTLRLYTPSGTLNCAASLQEVGSRGNSTWEEEKKPYRMKLAVEQDLLGMGTAEDLVLLANAFDSSHIRNKAAYDLACQVQAAYSPEAQWVDLYANGTYLGLYLLTERNQISPQRVAIPENESFLVSMEWPARTQWEQFPNVLSERGNLLKVRQNALGQERLLQVWQSVENAIYADDGIDPVSGKRWHELVDVDSWAEQYLLREVFADGDACAMSQFFYYSESSGRVFAGPLWDMDNILNCWNTQTPNVLTAARKHVWGPEEEALFYTLCQKGDFRERMLQIYYERFRPLLTVLSSEGFDRYTGIVSKAASMDAARWDKVYTSESTDEMAAFLKERMAFLENYWASPEDYCILESAGDVQWRDYALRRGESAQALSASLNVQWIEYESGTPFDLSQPIMHDTIVRMIERIP